MVINVCRKMHLGKPKRENKQAYHFCGKSLPFKTCLAKDGNIINVFFEVEEEAECAKLCR